MIDLHMHTVFSDGASTPEELVQALAAQKLEAFAVTDHDNTVSLQYVEQAAEGTGMTVIPGIEINTYWGTQEVHVLGYYIDPEADALQEIIDEHRVRRVEQMKRFADKLKGLARLDVSYDDIAAKAKASGVMGRPHVAQVILEKGGAANIGEAFSKYLGKDCLTYVNRDTVSPHEAVEAIYESGGIPVIAHPKDMEGVEALAKDLMNYGLRGLEAYHRGHSPAHIEFHCTLAEKLGLIVTGGTDFHGTGDLYEKSFQRLCMPDMVYKILQQERDNRRMSMFKAS
jgi:3',5'-nucleoside bisphosphate phosphatase